MIIQFCLNCNKKLNTNAPALHCRGCMPRGKLPPKLCKCGSVLSARHVKQCLKCRIAPSIKFCKGCGKRMNRAIRLWCRPCYKKELSERSKLQTGSKNPYWKGGKTKHSRGYVYIRDVNHPSTKLGYVFEHRLVMEKHLGRYLKNDEVIHHINGIKNDNRIENLKVMTQSEHIKLHHRNPA